jgi:hypothetical protein
MVYVTFALNKVEFILNSKSYFELFTYVYDYLKLQDPFIDQHSFNLFFNKNNIDYIIDDNCEITETEYTVVLKVTNNIFKYYLYNNPYKLLISNYYIHNNNKLIELLCKYHNIDNGTYNISISDNSNSNIYYKSNIIIKSLDCYKSYSCYDKEQITITNYNIYNNEINNKLNLNNIIYVLNIEEII